MIYQRLFIIGKFSAKPKQGKIFIQSKRHNVNSKEFEATILASNPVDFEIDFDRNNSYADGKELTTLTTSVIKDKFGNIIENGTLVSFVLKGSNIDTKGTWENYKWDSNNTIVYILKKHKILK